MVERATAQGGVNRKKKNGTADDRAKRFRELILLDPVHPFDNPSYQGAGGLGFGWKKRLLT